MNEQFGLFIFWAKAIGAFVAFAAAALKTVETAWRVYQGAREFAKNPDVKSTWRQWMRPKGIVIVSSLLVMSFALATCAYVDASNPLRKGVLAVLPFENKSNKTEKIELPGANEKQSIDQYSWYAATELLALLSSEPAVTKHFDVVNQRRLVEAIDQMELGKSVLFDKERQLTIGKLLQAGTLICGSINQISVVPGKIKIGEKNTDQVKVTVGISLEIVQTETNKSSTHRYEGSASDWQTDSAQGMKSDKDLILEAITDAMKKVGKDEKFIQGLKFAEEK